MVTEKQREGLIAMTKIGSVWAMVGITSWADFAAMLAAIYSLLMIAGAEPREASASGNLLYDTRKNT